MSQADEIRKYVYERYIRPAKQKGDKSVTIRAGDIGKEMNISGNMPNICQALGGKKLAEMYGIRIEISDDPNPSTTTKFTYILENIEEQEKLKNHSINLTILLKDVKDAILKTLNWAIPLIIKWLSDTLHWLSRRSIKEMIIIFFVCLNVFAILVTNFGSNEKTSVAPVASPKTIETPQQSHAQAEEVMPQYNVLNEDIYDDIFNGVYIKTQYTLNILVSGEITEQSLRALLTDLYTKIQQRQFENRRNPTHFVIYAYTSKEYAESDMGQWIAMLTKLGDKEIKISFNELQMAQIGVKPEEKFGLSEAQRKQIWSEIVKAEDSGLSREKIYSELAKKYSLTPEQVEEIRIEGLTNDWPFPKYQGN